MESKSSPLLILVILLLVANLVLTSLLYQKVEFAPVAEADVTTAQNPLPESLNKETLGEIFSKFQTAYNSGDFQTFYSLFSEFARAQMDADQMLGSYDQLRDFFGDVEKGVFSHYEFSGEMGNMKSYTLHYVVNLTDASKFGRNGTLKIGITWDGTSYGVISSYLFASSG